MQKTSNCLIEAVLEFSRNPMSIRIKKKGSLNFIRERAFPHFYWYDKRDGEYYHFCAKYSDEPLIKQLWFEGRIKVFRYHKTKG